MLHIIVGLRHPRLRDGADEPPPSLEIVSVSVLHGEGLL